MVGTHYLIKVYPNPLTNLTLKSTHPYRILFSTMDKKLLPCTSCVSITLVYSIEVHPTMGHSVTVMGQPHSLDLMVHQATVSLIWYKGCFQEYLVTCLLSTASISLGSTTWIR